MLNLDTLTQLHPEDERAGTFLTQTTHLTRVVVLGETLAADFEEAVLHGRLNAQLWIDSRLA